MRRLLIALVACATLAFAGCGDDDSTTGTTAATETTTGAQSVSTDTKTKPEIEVPEDQPPAELVEEDVVEGKGRPAKAGDAVTVQYVGVGYESGEEFDASWGGEPITFQLGSGQVIEGWDQGLQGMKVGGRRQLTIPPDLAYGEAGFPPSIGPNETLIFVVDLVGVR